MEEGSLFDKLQHLQLHVQTAERGQRPVLDFTGQTPEQEDYEHFQYLFSLYKDRLGLGLNNALLLCECLAMGISRAIFRSYGDEMKNLTKDQLFRAEQYLLRA